MCFYGVGNHGGGPTRAEPRQHPPDRRHRGQPRLRFSSPGASSPGSGASGYASVPVVDGELQHHAVGCYSAHSGIKAAKRRAEQLLATAEAWSTVGAAPGRQPRRSATELRHAWKQLLFNQFHDILAGSALESAYVDARDQLGEAVAIAARVANRAVSVSPTIRHPLHEDTQPLLLFNPLPWPTRATVELEFGAHGGFENVEVLLSDADDRPVEIQRTQSEAVFPDRRRLVFEADVPAFGYRLLPAVAGRPSSSALPVDQVPRPRRRPRLRATDTAPRE